MTDLTELKRLLAAGTPGPWENSDGKIWIVGIEYGMEAGCCGNFRPSGECCGNAIAVQTEEQVQQLVAEAGKEDAALIVAAVNSLSALIARVEAAEAALVPFAIASEGLDGLEGDEPLVSVLVDGAMKQVTARDFRTARGVCMGRAALGAKQ